MLKLTNTLLFLLLLFPTWAKETRDPATIDFDQLAQEVLDFKTINQVVQISDELLELCPPSHCQVISLGRSPTLITEYLERKKLTSVLTLPISQFRFSPYSVNALNAVAEEKLFRYFDDFLTPGILNQTKEVMLLDFSLSGRSLFAVQAYLERYFSSREKVLNTFSFIMAGEQNVNNINHFSKVYKVEKPYIKILPKESNFLRSMQMQHFDDFSRYQAYPIVSKSGHVLDYLPKENQGHGRTAFEKYFTKQVKEYESRIPAYCQKLGAKIFQYRQ